MLNTLLSKIIGTKNERELKRIQPLAEKINTFEPWAKGLTDAEMPEQTAKFRERLDRGESLDSLLPEAFALVREAGRRVLNMRHFDVQLIGGVVLYEGKIAEMKTGEGKTLVATLPAYLNALTGRGVHIVTVNDYLAKRDSQWMGGIYRLLGLTVGLIQHDMRDQERQKAYAADITYGTNNEFGFDYLRDNMKFSREQLVQRELNYAIVDEVDSILVDEARTPLIISGPTEESTDKYYQIDRIIPRLRKDEDYQVDEKARTVALTEAGIAKAERFLGIRNLYDPKNMEWVHHINQALKAHVLFQRDVDYMVKDGEVIIVDEFTGRLMPGRRYSEGLHQALEAKERVKIERENQTLASITFQNYFRMYKKLAGMTGTADTEAPEFAQIYNLDVMVIPPNRTLIRHTHPDAIYRNEKEKFNCVVNEIVDCYKRGQPALVGTISIEKSERLSKLLKQKGIAHQVLNAKYHEREAEIVAQAGRLSTVTIATNMAGRGTDILLGGNPEFLTREHFKKQSIEVENVSSEAYLEAFREMEEITRKEHDQVVGLGGLHIIGTERHESRRIDNQLRGRAGRQGDPGSSRFYLSLEDDLMRIFGSDRLSSIMGKIGVEENQPIEHNLVSKAIETAQKRVEAHNFSIRKHLLEYDDVMNKQRKVIYEQRRKVLDGEDLKGYVFELVDELLEGLLDLHAVEEVHPEDWDIKALGDGILRQFGTQVAPEAITEYGDREELFDFLRERIINTYEERETLLGVNTIRELERFILLQVIDNQWKDHLLSMDHLKEGIGLRGYGQKDPLLEYKREGFDLFSDMVERIKEEVVEYLFKVQLVPQESEVPAPSPPPAAKASAQHQKVAVAEGNDRKERKVGRNDPCPCGSGKKYKKCCGR